MTVLIVIGVVMLTTAAFSVAGHLCRIADAIEAQNRSYGVVPDMSQLEAKQGKSA